MALCNPHQQWFDLNGKPLAGGRLYAYLAGTTTPTTTWQDAGLGILNTNPVILDAFGFSTVWLNSTAVYKFRMTDRWGVQQWTVDNVSGDLLCAPSGPPGPPPPIGPPTVTSISPASGPPTGGTTVTITGTNFAAGAIVTFNGTAATNVTVVNATTITCTAPAGTVATTVGVTVTVGGQSGSLPNAFAYVAGPPVPTVTSVSPNTGPANATTDVTITGTNFATGATVTFGGIPATNVAVVNSTTITCTTPALGAGAVTVAVTEGGQTGILANGFAYTGPLALVSVTVSPTSIQGGTGNPTGTVRLSSPAPAGGIVVTLLSSDTAIATVPTSVTVPAGQTTATFTVTTFGVSALSSVSIFATYNSVQQAANLTVTPGAVVAPIYGGVGAGGGGAPVNISGTNAILSNSVSLPQLQNTAETVGQTLGPFSPSDQFVYLLLMGSGHAFVDQNNNVFAMNPPITVTAGGATMYLYQSANALYLTWTIKVAS